MFWVMVLVSARAIRGSRDDEAEYDVVFDEAAARVVKEEDWWFESEDGHALKWCVPPPRLAFTAHAH